MCVGVGLGVGVGVVIIIEQIMVTINLIDGDHFNIACENA